MSWVPTGTKNPKKWALVPKTRYGQYLKLKPVNIGTESVPYQTDTENQVSGNSVSVWNQYPLTSSLLLHIDGSGPIVEDIGHQVIAYRRRIPFVELFSKIDAVDAATIKHVANRFIFDQVIIFPAHLSHMILEVRIFDITRDMA
ncbi:putative metalloenzyme, LuxS/M16 peptidase [Helianthus anomalus]